MVQCQEDQDEERDNANAGGEVGPADFAAKGPRRGREGIAMRYGVKGRMYLCLYSPLFCSQSY